MGGDFTVAILVFIVSATVVMYCGAKLAVYGEALASLTGWGRLFVGSLLVALATSLPELSTNVSAVRLDPPNPGLALGDILGSNMLNMFILTAVALVLIVLYEKTDNLLAPIIAHAIFNTSNVAMIFMASKPLAPTTLENWLGFRYAIESVLII